MSPTLRQLGIDRLTPQERLDLIGEIWDSLDSIHDVEVPREHLEVLDRSLDAANGNVGGGTSWEELRKKIEQKKKP
jgi:putative addiction module component (TIGR02574 family)